MFFFFILKPFVVTCLWAGASCCCDVKSPRAETDADGLLPEFQKWSPRLMHLFCFYINPQAILLSCIVNFTSIHRLYYFLALWNVELLRLFQSRLSDFTGVIFQFEWYFSNELDCNGLYVGWHHCYRKENERVGG